MFSNAAYVRTIEQAVKSQRDIHNKIWEAASNALGELKEYGSEANTEYITDKLNVILAELGRPILPKE